MHRSGTGPIALLAGTAHAAKLALAVCADWLLPDYDSSASLNAALCGGGLDIDGAAVNCWLPSSLLVWDAVHNAHIACRGYEAEHQYAFFPLLPGAREGAS
jgi:hypothetical protein